jgi:plastocyanin
LVSSRSGSGFRGRTRLPSCGALLAIGVLAAGAPAAQSTGSVEGRVRFDGPPPAGTLVEESGAVQPSLHLDANGFVRFAVAYLPDAPPAGGAAETEVTVDQRGFVFDPQVIAVRSGQVVRFTNADAANHNVRARGGSANTFSLNTAPGDGSGRRVHRFAATERDRPVRLSCDIHPWMAAWVYAFDHDRFAVTDAGGRFWIEGIQPGRHRLAVRQPAAGLARDLAVEVQAGKTTAVEVRFSGRDIGMPGR